ncbi:MAG: Dabb family protein [Micromonosporaceae bacterium]
MLRHVVLFTWTPEATADQRRAVAEELRKLPGVIAELRHYDVGPDAGMNPANFDFAVVADFDDREGYLAYRDHPAHRAVVDKHITPILGTRATVQYEIGV